MLSTAKSEIEAWTNCNKKIEDEESFIASKKKNINEKQNETDNVGWRIIWLATTILWLPVIYMIDTKNGLSGFFDEFQKFYNEFSTLQEGLKVFILILLFNVV